MQNETIIAKKQMHWALFVPAILLLTVLLFGCGKHEKKPSRSEIEASNAEDVRIFAIYLTGTVDQARVALNQTIEHVQKGPMDPSSQAAVLGLEHYRLYVLEKRIGNTNAAMAALIKARYWQVTHFELKNELNDDAMKYIMADTEKAESGVDAYDRGANNGHLPSYVQNLPRLGPNPKQP